jgi:tRNA pseudouridine55 synthase
MTAPHRESNSGRQAVDGVLLLDKPAGITSQAAVSGVKRLFSAVKAGHTGTLDPMASGLLPICLGEATKFSHMLLEADKTYTATVLLGLTTTTGDMEGEVTQSSPVDVDRWAVERVLAGFVGQHAQMPPMYSALKHGGKALYHYARAGLTVERKPRPVRIHRLEIAHFQGVELTFIVTCSKGTYIRVLAEDIGRALGPGGCLSALRRTAIGSLAVENACGLDELRAMGAEERLPRLGQVDTLVAALPRLDLDAEQTRSIRNGAAIAVALPPGLVRIYGPSRDYLGVAMAETDGRLVPRRLMAQRGCLRTPRLLPDIA